MKAVSSQAAPTPVPKGTRRVAASSSLAKEAAVPPAAPSPPAADTNTCQLPIIQLVKEDPCAKDVPGTTKDAGDVSYNTDLLGDDTDDMEDSYYNLRRFMTGSDDNGMAPSGYAQPRTRGEAAARMEAEIAACLVRLAGP